MRRIAAQYVYLGRNSVVAKGVLDLDNPVSAFTLDENRCEPAGTEFRNGILCPAFVSLAQRHAHAPNCIDFSAGKSVPETFSQDMIFDFGEMPLAAVARKLADVQARFPSLSVFDILACCCDNPLSALAEKKQANSFYLLEHIDFSRLKLTAKTVIRKV